MYYYYFIVIKQPYLGYSIIFLSKIKLYDLA